MPYYRAYKRSRVYRRTRRTRNSTVKKVARSKPRAARYTLAKKVDSLSRQVQRNKLRLWGELQRSRQILNSATFPQIYDQYPLLFTVTQMNVTKDGVSPNSNDSTRIYQRDTTGTTTNVMVAAYFKAFNDNNSLINADHDFNKHARQNQPNGGQMYASWSSMKFTFKGSPNASDKRIKIQFFKIKPVKTDSPDTTIDCLLGGLQRMCTGNVFNKAYFDVLYTRHVYLNAMSAATSGAGSRGSGPRSIQVNVFMRHNKLIVQKNINPELDTQPPPVGPAWDPFVAGPYGSDRYSHTYCLISCDDPLVDDHSGVKVNIERSCAWRDSTGNYQLT